MSKYMEFERGNAVIVGKPMSKSNVSGTDISNTDFNVDGVLVYDAYCLSSDTPYLLQATGQHFKEGETIYICGHGDEKTQTISGYTMQKIAKLLYQNYNYIGAETIKIMSCYAKYKKDDKDMADLLVQGLNAVYKGNKTEITVTKDKVQAICEFTTIVIDFFGKALVLDKYPIGGIAKELKSECFYKKQSNYQKKSECKYLSLNIGNYQDQLKEYLEKKYIKGVASKNYMEFARE